MKRFFSTLRDAVIPVLLAATLLNGCGRKPASPADKKTSTSTEAARKERPSMLIKDFAANSSDGKGQNFFIRGDALPLGKDLYSLTNMVIQIERNGAVDTVIETTDCIYDHNAGTASSAGRLAVRTSDGRLAVRGRGFRFLKSESSLVISNDVQTEVRKMTSRTNAPSTATNLIQVFSDRLDYRSDRAIFTGHVRAVEPGQQLATDSLRVHFRPGGSNRFERIEADGSVIFDQGAGRATSDKATYLPQDAGDVIHLNGHAVWNDPQRRAAADTLTLDRAKNVIRAEGNARLRLLRQGLDSAGPLITTSASPRETSSEATNFVNLSSRAVTLELGGTNSVLRAMQAEGDVELASDGDEARATGQKLLYDGSAGLLSLTGKPRWESAGRFVEGDALTFDRTNRVFIANGNAHVHLPVAALGTSSLLAPNPALKAGVTGLTNRFVEAFAARFEYRTNRMDFHRNVRAQFLDAGEKRAEIESATLQINAGQRLEKIIASGGATARQFPASASQDRRTARELSGETLSAEMDSEGRLASISATRNVKGSQTASRGANRPPVETRFSSDSVIAKFTGVTNRLETVVAERNVVVEQEGRVAEGDHAVFDGASRIVELTGHAKARFPEGRITTAEVLAWDAARERLIVRGQFKSEWQRAGLRTAAADSSGPAPVNPK